MLHAVTLGGTGAERGDRHPKIGRGVLLGAGAKVLGNITVGDYAKVASGSVVLKPVPAGCTVAHKTGTGGYGPVNDIGLILPPNAAPIAIAIYFRATKDSTDAQREAVIADATRQALKALGHG